MKKTLKETYTNQLNLNVNIAELALYEKISEVFINEPYAELSIALGTLKGLRDLFQSYHWQSKGKEFYSDHLLYQKIYEQVNEQIDSVGEKVLTLTDNESMVDALRLQKAALVFVFYNTKSSPEMHIRAKHSLDSSIIILDEVCNRMESKNRITRGVENLLSGIIDELEQSSYLLKQRATD